MAYSTRLFLAKDPRASAVLDFIGRNPDCTLADMLESSVDVDQPLLNKMLYAGAIHKSGYDGRRTRWSI